MKTEDMIVYLIALLVLAVLYGLAWHERPVDEPIGRHVPKAKQDEKSRPDPPTPAN